MPQISNLSFNVSFEPHNPNRVGLINTTPDLPAGFVGIFKVTQPDGYVRNGDINTPDVTNVVSSCVITIVPDSSGQLQQGQYTIEFIGNAPGYLSTSFIRTFTFQYTPATISLRNDFDVFTPQLAYTDISNYNVSGYTISTGPTRRWDATSTTTGTISGTNSSIDIRYNNQYYAETYSIEFRVNVAYVSQAYPWLSITHTRTQTTSVTACIPKSLEDLTQAVEALREESNASCGGDWARFEKANSLYVHLINMLRLVLIAGEHQDGFFDVYQQLLTYIQNGSVACDSIGQVIPPYDFSDYESSIYDGQSSYCQLVGDGVNTVYRVNHQLGDQCVVVQVYEVATGKQVFCDVAVSTINSIDITFFEPPTLNQYRVVAVAGALGLRGKGFQPGGLTGQILRKKTNADFDTEWADVTVALPLLVPYNGATQSVYLGEHGIEAGFVRLDTTPTATPATPAVMSWNDTDGTAEIRLKGNNVTLQVGQEMVARVVNKTGANLLGSQYKAVRVRKVSEGGAQGQRLAVVLAQANTEFMSTDMLGIVTENIDNNQEGFITTFGAVKNIDTTGALQGEVWADGDILFLSPTVPGGLTKVKPSAPNHLSIVGYVEYAHQNNGKIFVHVQTSWELDELHNVSITNPVNNQVLKYNGTLWVNSTFPAVTSVGLATATSGVTITDTPVTSSGVININIATASASSNGLLSSADWATFNAKQSALTFGNISTATSGVTITNGNASTVGPNVSISIATAGSGQNGLLSAADWATFNAKQSAITLTTTGNSGAATFVGSTLNIPNYTLAGLGGVPTTRSLTINGTAYDLSADRTWSVGTVTSVSALTIGTAGTDITSTVATGTTTPVITLNIPTASAINRGALSSTDWTTFNNKQNTITLTTTGNSGASTFIGATLNIPTYTLSGLGGVPTSRTLTINGTALDLSTDRSWSVGTVTSVSALTIGTTGTDVSSSVATGTTTPVITLNIPTASGTNRGALSAADWTTFNNKQNAITLTTTGTSGAATLVGSTLNIPQYQSVLTNPVTGTGTTNYITKWTDTNTTGNSQIFDNGTNVGIGTSSPVSGSALDIAGSTNVYPRIRSTGTGEAFMFFQNTNSGTTAADGLFVGINSGNDAFFYNAEATPARFFTSGTERLRISASGDVGIGTSSFSAITNYTSLFLNSASSGTSVRLLTSNNNAAEFRYDISGAAFADIGTLASWPFLLKSAGVERMRIHTNGRIGVNTTTDAGYQFDVNGSIRATSTIRSDGNFYNESANPAYSARLNTIDGQRINMEMTGTNGRIQVTRNSGAQPSLIFATEGGENMRIAPTGNVGVGTASPSYRIDAFVNTNGFDGYNVYGQQGGVNEVIGFRSTQGNGIGLIMGTTGVSATSAVGGPNQSVIYSVGSQNLILGTNSADRLRISSAGVITVANLAGSGARVVVADASGNLSATTLSSSVTTGSGTTNYVTKWTGASTQGDSQIFDNGTNVGIGTASPLVKLDIVGSAGTVVRTKGGTGVAQGSAYYVQLAGSTNTLSAFGDRANIFGGTPDQVASVFTGSGIPLTFDVNTAERMRITSSGDVGIGTTSPNIYSSGAHKYLTVSNNAGGGYSIATVAGGAGGGGEIDFGNQTIRHAAIASLDGSNFGIYTNNTNSGTGVTERLRITSGGDVGIGTSSPTGTANRFVNIYGAASNELHLTNATTGTTSTDGFTILQSGNDVYQYNYESGFLEFGTSNASRLRIFANGRIGINTTTDAGYQLDVNGTFRTTGSTDLASSGGEVRIAMADAGAYTLQVGGPVYFANAANTSLTTSAGLNYMAKGDNTYFSGFNFQGVAASDMFFGRTASSDDLVISTSNTGSPAERVRFKQNGDVGIGTNAPSYKLDINGTLRSVNGANFATTSGNVLIGTATASSVSTARLSILGSGVQDSYIQLMNGAGGGFLMGSLNGTGMQFYTLTGTQGSESGTKRMEINSNGEMLINTSTDAGDYKLQVSGNIYNTGSAVLAATSGNVGIGVTPSAWSLGKAVEIKSEGNSIWSYDIENMFVTNNAYFNGGWKYGKNGKAATYTQFQGQHFWDIAGTGTAGNAITFTTAMAISNSGNVGIGTTSPSSLGKVGIQTDGGTGAGVGIYSPSTTNGAKITLFDNINNAGIYGAPETLGTNLVFQTNSTEKLRIRFDGNVGIGTTGPSKKLVVAAPPPTFSGDDGITVIDPATANQTYLARCGSTYTYRGVPANAGMLYSNTDLSLLADSGYAITFHTSSGHVARLTAAGNFGIGTTSPTSKLHISTASGSIFEQITSGENQMYLGYDVVGNNMTVQSNGSLALHTGSLATERMRIFANGRVAINTTTDAGYQLDVNGGTRVTGKITVTANDALGLSIARAGTSAIASEIYNGGGDNGWLLYGVESSAGGVIFPGTTAYASVFGSFRSVPVQFATNNAVRMTIDGGGSVGIGVASPSASAILQVDSTTKGMLPPRMTTTQRDAITSPATGLIVYDTTVNKISVYNGTTWKYAQYE